LENLAPLYCYPQLDKRNRISDNPFYYQGFLLSGFSNQSQPSARKSLDILLPQGRSGTFNPQIEKQFCISKNSYKIIFSKPGVFRNCSLGIRFSDGFQTPLSSTSISKLDNFYTSQKSLPTISRIGSSSQLQFASFTGSVPLSESIPMHPKNSCKNKTTYINFDKFANELLTTSDEQCIKIHHF
jgi:hypothetical protein